jgi:hypothetical protein
MEERELLDLINKVYHEAATEEEDGMIVIEEVSDVEETSGRTASSGRSSPTSPWTS